MKKFGFDALMEVTTGRMHGWHRCTVGWSALRLGMSGIGRFLEINCQVGKAVKQRGVAGLEVRLQAFYCLVFGPQSG